MRGKSRKWLCISGILFIIHHPLDIRIVTSVTAAPPCSVTAAPPCSVIAAPPYSEIAALDYNGHCCRKSSALAVFACCLVAGNIVFDDKADSYYQEGMVDNGVPEAPENGKLVLGKGVPGAPDNGKLVPDNGVLEAPGNGKLGLDNGVLGAQGNGKLVLDNGVPGAPGTDELVPGMGILAVDMGLPVVDTDVPAGMAQVQDLVLA